MTSRSNLELSLTNDRSKPELVRSNKLKETELDGIDDGLLPPAEDGELPEKGGGFPDINVYQHKKTLAQGMMDLALLSANANQLRYVLERGQRHSYYYASLILISLSLLLQVTVGIGLIWNSRYNIHKNKHMQKANKINNFTVIGIFIITVLNVFISAFGVPGLDELAPLVESVDTNLTEYVKFSKTK